MTAVTMPIADGTLTEDDVQFILRLSALGLKLIGEGASVHKIATVFNDIRRVTSLRTSTSYSVSNQINTPCSACAGYLPNEAEYLYCLAHCT